MSHPLADAETLAGLERHTWPTVDQLAFSDHIGRMKSYSSYAVSGGIWSCWMEVADALLGTEKFMIMMLTEPEFVEALLDRIVTFIQGTSRQKPTDR